MRLAEFKLTAADFGTFGQGLERPECVWIDEGGVWVSDARAAVARVEAEGPPVLLGSGVRDPNGFSRRPDGSFVVAGLTDGAVHLVALDGTSRILIDRFGGAPLGAVNYVCADGPDRLWVTVMTRALPWHQALTTRRTDGYILKVEDEGRRCEIVADGLDLTNEVKVSPDRRWLYAVETLGRRIVRFPLSPEGVVGAKEVFGPGDLGHGAFPDGITFDGQGHLWITMISDNGLYVLDTNGELHLVYRDPNPRAVDDMAAGAARW